MNFEGRSNNMIELEIIYNNMDLQEWLERRHRYDNNEYPHIICMIHKVFSTQASLIEQNKSYYNTKNYYHRLKDPCIIAKTNPK